MSLFSAPLSGLQKRYAALESGVSENAAAAINGGTISASSGAGSNYPIESVIDGYRHTRYMWGAGGGWSSAGMGFPVRVEAVFARVYNLTEINIFTLADAINYTSDPTLADTFSSYGITAFVLEAWNGSTWDVLQTVSGNNKIWRQFAVSVATSKIAVQITASADIYARLVEVEAFGV